jgi:hypothetical protein
VELKGFNYLSHTTVRNRAILESVCPPRLRLVGLRERGGALPRTGELPSWASLSERSAAPTSPASRR